MPTSGATPAPMPNCTAPSMAAAVPAASPCRDSASAGVFGSDSPTEETTTPSGTSTPSSPPHAGEPGQHEDRGGGEADEHRAGEHVHRAPAADQDRVELGEQREPRGVGPEHQPEGRARRGRTRPGGRTRSPRRRRTSPTSSVRRSTPARRRSRPRAGRGRSAACSAGSAGGVVRRAATPAAPGPPRRRGPGRRRRAPRRCRARWSTRGSPRRWTGRGSVRDRSPASASTSAVRRRTRRRGRARSPWRPPRSRRRRSPGAPGRRPALRCSVPGRPGRRRRRASRDRRATAASGRRRPRADR